MIRLRTPFAVCAAVAAASLLTACGQSVASRRPELSGVPLTAGARVLASVRRCDPGANAYCAIQLVIADHRFGNSTQLLKAETRQLHDLGWTSSDADTGDEHAAESPGHRLRLIYATAALDLKDVDLGWVQRTRTISLTLSDAMFDRNSSLSLMLETGSS